MTETPEQVDSSTPVEQPLVSHLVELRDRLMRMVIAVLLVFLGLFPFANDIYQFVSRPLLGVLPEGQEMIATGVISPFLAPFKLSLVAAIFIAIPYILYQLWAFIAPGLYKHEKRVLIPMVGSSAVLFYLGAAFAYFVVFPLVFSFMQATTPDGVNMTPDIAQAVAEGGLLGTIVQDPVQMGRVATQELLTLLQQPSTKTSAIPKEMLIPVKKVTKQNLPAEI